MQCFKALISCRDVLASTLLVYVPRIVEHLLLAQLNEIFVVFKNA